MSAPAPSVVNPAVSALSWLWHRRQWVAAGAAVLATAHYLRQQTSPTHTEQQQQPSAAVVATGHAAGDAACPPAAVDKSLFPSFIPSASVPGVLLFTRAWRVSHPPRAVVFLLHGYGEHSGRYESLAAALNSLGASVYALDHVGHGQSGGDRAHVERLHHYVQDALAFIEGVQKGDEFAKVKPPAFLFGHSMGGLIASLVMQASYTAADAASASSSASSSSSSHSSGSLVPAASPSGLPHLPLSDLQSRWRGRLWPWVGCVLSSPALAPTPADAKPALVALALVLSRHLPKLQLTGLDVEGISRSAEVVQHYKNDPLVWHGRMRARWAVEMMSAMECLKAELEGGHVQFPMLVIQGTADRMVHAPGAAFMHEHSTAKDKTFRSFEGGYHELLNDPVTQQEALQEITGWIQARIVTQS